MGQNEKLKVQYANGGSTYKPLIKIVGVVILLTIISSVFLPLESGTDVVRYFMGSFFLVFGFLKAVKLKDFAMAYSKYDLIARHSSIYAKLYPFIELGFAVAYFTNWNQDFTNWAVLLVMLVSALGVYLTLQKGQKIQCACLGTVFKLPMTWVTLVEDLLMALMAFIMLS